MTARIDISSLVLGSELHAGSRSSVVQLEQPRDAHGGVLVFKRYRPGTTSHVDAVALDALGDLPGRAGPEAIWLRERTAWPRTLVTEGVEVVGFLMRAIPAEFSFGQVTGSGTVHMSAEFTYLLNEDRILQDLGLLISDRDRLLLLTDVVDALQRLHRLGVRVGDLSARNLVFAPSTHRSFFLNCDAMRLGDADVLPLVHTPGWELPEGEEPGTPAADVYKFGLLATRMIARNPTERDPSRLGHISARFAALAAATLNGDARNRPTLDDWMAELRMAAAAASPVSPEVTVSVAMPPAADPVPAASAPAPPAPAHAPEVALTVPAADIVGTPGSAPSYGPPPEQPSRKRVSPLVVTGAVVVAAGIAAGAAAAAGAFGSTSGTVASTTIDGSRSGSGLVGTGTPATSGSTTAPTGTPSTTGSTTDTPSPTGTTSSTPTPTPTPPPPPPVTSSVGVVQIDASLVADPRAVPVATLFDSFFAAVTAKDFDAALALYDPNGDVDTNDAQQRAAFKKSEATSTDDQGVLKSLSPGGTGPATTAVITFRSRQAAGYGPSDTPEQTCSVWTLTYTLTPAGGGYLIKSATGSHTGC
ncbi:hypothetical protein [Catenulispora subtropica]|uniref:Protein kinase domain-containing protein n=1 Tax=Catenulispora subtropica TaxID=450798 RepID=A0ABN2SCJ1_9ACTN